jgi:molybdate transport system substrate-binding protein
LGLAIRAGARKPDIGTVDAFTRTLVEARSITYPTEGASAAPFVALTERLGISEALKPKLVLTATAAQVGDAVSSGRVELGVIPVSEILLMKGVELVGPFPSDIQSYVVMTAGVNTQAMQAGAARELIRFLTAPAATPVIKVKGMER